MVEALLSAKVWVKTSSGLSMMPAQEIAPAGVTQLDIVPACAVDPNRPDAKSATQTNFIGRICRAHMKRSASVTLLSSSEGTRVTGIYHRTSVRVPRPRFSASGGSEQYRELIHSASIPPTRLEGSAAVKYGLLGLVEFEQYVPVRTSGLLAI